MNESNLIPLNQRTKEERREIATQGGIASGQSRRERKAIRAALEECLAMDTELGGKTVTNVEAIAAAMVKKAREGDVRAFVEVRDSVGEKPAEHIVSGPTISPETYAEVEMLLFGGGDDE